MHQPHIELKSFVVERHESLFEHHLFLNARQPPALFCLVPNTCTKDQMSKELLERLRFTPNADLQVLMLRRALEEASSTHPSVVIWMDADALVVDQEKSLDFFLSQETSAERFV